MPMYFVVISNLMLIFPVGSVALEIITCNANLSAVLVAKWFVIWSVGMRLFLAGSRQIIQPRYTATVILSLKHDESLILVR
jgi:hypothetical protein